jgi:diketogulonate reductase-like aldo/keto reductase
LSAPVIDYSDRKEIGRTGEKVSAIGLGTWAIRDYERAYKVFMYALEHGIDNIDTAEMYGSGRAEEFVGRVVRDYGREQVFITTKMMPHHLVSREEVLRAGRRSLERLGVSYVDLFLIHWPNNTLSIEEQVRNFEVLVEEGVTRYIGVSNFTRYELERALEATRKTEIVVDQVHYSVLHREPEASLLPYAIEKHITIQAYTPLEKGSVADHPVLARIGMKYGKTPVQVALNYLIAHPRVIAIPKTEDLDHLKEILGSMDWRLNPEDLRLLSSI